MKQREKSCVLVADDNLEMATMLAEGLQDAGFDAFPVASGKVALEMISTDQYDALVSDLRMPDLDGLQLLQASKKQYPDRPVLIMTAYGAVDTAVESIRQGAYHYLTKPFKTEELIIFLNRALDERKLRAEAKALKSLVRQRFSISSIVGRSKAITAMFDVIERVADSLTPVLLVGETGTGKGLVASALHAESKRAAGPFVTVNCAALPESLLESELFGHVKGAFTGALQNRIGLFAEASGGTIFLDEIGDMALPLQAKLLHVLESGTVRPVGAEKELPLDVRVIAATNRSLRDDVQANRFREDLLYRLDVVSMEVPPLRHRRDDIPELIDHFFVTAKARHPKSPVDNLSAEAINRLMAHDWPGNVRELEHLIERLVVLGKNVEVAASELPPLTNAGRPAVDLAFGNEVIPIREMQRRYATWALEKLYGHRGRTAERLGVDNKTLAKWLSERE